MLSAYREGDLIRVIRTEEGACIGILTLTKSDGATETRVARFPEMRGLVEIPAVKGVVSFDLEALALPTLICKKELSQGQHHTPPKGYPTDKDDYAVPEYYEYPIDRKHIHAAISYFDKHKWKTSEHKRRAARRILDRAKKVWREGERGQFGPSRRAREGLIND